MCFKIQLALHLSKNVNQVGPQENYPLTPVGGMTALTELSTPPHQVQSSLPTSPPCETSHDNAFFKIQRRKRKMKTSLSSNQEVGG